MKGDVEAAKRALIENSNTNVARILSSLDSLSVEVKQGFDGVGTCRKSVRRRRKEIPTRNLSYSSAS
jgi:hypothetical protein